MPKLQANLLLPGIPLDMIENLSPSGATFALRGKRFRIDSPVVEVSRTATFVRLYLTRPITFTRLK